MKTARIGGWPASSAEPYQPRGHYFDPAAPGTPTPQALDDEYVLSPWMNPSGGVHCSIHDFALYVQEHLLGLTGKGCLLDQDSYNTLHSIQITTNIREMYPYRNEDHEVSFGYGWAVTPKEWGNVSVAAGSGGTFFAQIFVDPARNIAFVGCTNCGNGGKPLNAIYMRITE
jgi:CubicO group peptidase (beta-lactamase class C family)